MDGNGIFHTDMGVYCHESLYHAWNGMKWCKLYTVTTPPSGDDQVPNTLVTPHYTSSHNTFAVHHLHHWYTY